MDHSKPNPPFLLLDPESVTSSNKNQFTNQLCRGRMDTETVLEEYGLSRETAAKYVDAITRSNQTQTAEELGVSRDTISRYKNPFQEMNAQERLFLISSLIQDTLLKKTIEADIE